MCACTGVVHNFCNPHGLLLRLVSYDALVHKCLLNTLERAIEQLAECLAKETKSAVEVKVQQHATHATVDHTLVVCYHAHCSIAYMGCLLIQVVL